MANLYHLTDAGSAAAEEIAESTTTAETVESLKQKVNQQQEQLDTLHDEVEMLREEVDELNALRAEFNLMAEIVEDLARHRDHPKRERNDRAESGGAHHVACLLGGLGCHWH
ncbi:hypothetical protein [Haladaptatus cibarius]|uniref:hypothetical protein n=1 Tax=Haladaptatus cibarius TaxID=453847 RepID=UPI0006784CCC|nr:hypothetical protein [Haladaptatus cibarius]